MNQNCRTHTRKSNLNTTQQERAANRALMVKFGDMQGPLTLALMLIEGARKLLGIIDVSEVREKPLLIPIQCLASIHLPLSHIPQGEYTANTSLLWHNRQLFALCEGDQPYLLHVAEDGKIETARRVHKGKYFG